MSGDALLYHSLIAMKLREVVEYTLVNASGIVHPSFGKLGLTFGQAVIEIEQLKTDKVAIKNQTDKQPNIEYRTTVFLIHNFLSNIFSQ